jgi:hypothetical protein
VKKLTPLIFSFYSLVLSLIFLPLYVEDDQLLYRLFYDSLGENDYLSGYALYANIIGSAEPIYYTLVFFLHSLVSKDLLFSLINAIFAYMLSKFICKYNKDWLLFYLSTNFYLMALFFSHERFKLAVTIFILLFLGGASSRFLKYALVVLAHFQMIMIVLINFLSKNQIQSTVKSNYFYKFIGIVLLMSIGVIFSDSLLSKFYSYSQSDVNIFGRISDVLKVTIFTAISILFCNKKSTAIIPNIILLPFIIMLGGGRLVILSYGYMMYFYITSKKNKNPLNVWAILIVNLYFSCAGLIFLYNIYSKGYGF